VNAVKGDDGRAKIDYGCSIFPTIDEDRVRMFYEFGKMMVASGDIPIVIVMIVEAWVSKSDTMEIKTMPSQDPNRMECVCLTAASYKGMCIGRNIPIYRNEHGHIVLAVGEGMTSEAHKIVDARLVTAIYTGVKEAMDAVADGRPVELSERYHSKTYGPDRPAGFSRRHDINPADGSDL
jgi:hypothetical protein